MRQFVLWLTLLLIVSTAGAYDNLPSGTEVYIPKGTYGWGYLNQLQASRDAYRSGDDQKALQVLKKNIRQGTIEEFKKKTKATVIDDAGEYVSLKPVGYSMKIWFAKDNIVMKTTAAKPNIKAEQKFLNMKGKPIKIVTAKNRARLCPEPQCNEGKELLRLPTNSNVIAKEATAQVNNAIWYNVEYQGKNGWVSQFDTNVK